MSEGEEVSRERGDGQVVRKLRLTGLRMLRNQGEYLKTGLQDRKDLRSRILQLKMEASSRMESMNIKVPLVWR